MIAVLVLQQPLNACLKILLVSIFLIISSDMLIWQTTEIKTSMDSSTTVQCKDKVQVSLHHSHASVLTRRGKSFSSSILGAESRGFLSPRPLPPRPRPRPSRGLLPPRPLLTGSLNVILMSKRFLLPCLFSS